MLRVAASRVGPLALSFWEGAHYFQAQAHLLWGVGKQYYTGYIVSLPVWSHVLYGDYDVTAYLVPYS